MANTKTNIDSPLQVFFLSLQFLLIFTLCWIFRVEHESGFPDLIPWIGGAAILHFFLPVAARRWFFILLFIVTCFLIMPWQSALCMLLFCALVYSMLLLPMVIQVAGLVVLFVLLFLSWYKVIGFDEFAYVFPYAGSLFMFRLFFYYYYRRAGYTEHTHIDRLTYFFQFTNLVFLLYPIIDFKEFVRSHRNRYSVKMITQGLNYCWRGLFLILLYRVVYYYCYPDPVTVDNAFDNLVFIIANFLLLFRVVGMFYLILGLLLLFGFEMSDVFGNYMAAPTIPIAWRRINTYWRNFMVRIFYNPFYFFFRKKIKKEVRLIFVAMMITFTLSGIVHFYQNYFIQGNVKIPLHDMLYWISFGLIVFLYIRKGLVEGENEPASLLKWLAGSLLVFAIMSVLYFLWTAESLAEFAYFMKKMTTWKGVKALSIVMLMASLIGFLLGSYAIEKALKKRLITAVRVNVFFTLVFGVWVTVWFLKEQAPQGGGQWAGQVFNPTLMNKRDRKEIERGYYHKVLNNEQLRIRRWEIAKGNKNWNAVNPALKSRNDILMNELVPGDYSFKGTKMHVNRYGLRDDDYSREKPANCIRIALLGGSYEMGSGVEGDQDFESFLERELTKALGKKVEIWNYGIGGFHLMQSCYLADKVLPAFHFDYVIHMAHSNEDDRIAADMSYFFRRKMDFVYPFLKDFVKKSGVRPNMCRSELDYRFYGLRDTLSGRLYAEFGRYVKNMGARPCVIYLPALGDEGDDRSPRQVAGACKINHIPFLSVQNAYDGYDVRKLYLTPWDNHPNKFGHIVIGKRMLAEILKEGWIKE